MTEGADGNYSISISCFRAAIVCKSGPRWDGRVAVRHSSTSAQRFRYPGRLV